MIVYFRESLTDREEVEAIDNCGFFYGVNYLGEASALNLTQQYPNHSLVIPRYTLEPYAHDQFREFELHSLVPINTERQYNWCKEIANWYEDLSAFTFRTYFDMSRLPEEKAFVLKGGTNSRKDLWNTHMFAANKAEAIQVMCRLQDDTLIGMQQCIAREYVPLKKLAEGPHGLPVTLEFRTFCLGNNILESGFYWHNYTDVISYKTTDYPHAFVQAIANKVASIHGDRFFYVLDVAITEEGNPVLVEVNSGEMSGLACCDPDILYARLQKELVRLALRKVDWLQ